MSDEKDREFTKSPGLTLPSGIKVNFVKSTGWDWVVEIIDGEGGDGDEPEPELLVMTVFGQVTVEAVLAEARASFDCNSDNPNYEIISIKRCAA